MENLKITNYFIFEENISYPLTKSDFLLKLANDSDKYYIYQFRHSLNLVLKSLVTDYQQHYWCLFEMGDLQLVLNITCYELSDN